MNIKIRKPKQARNYNSIKTIFLLSLCVAMTACGPVVVRKGVSVRQYDSLADWVQTSKREREEAKALAQLKRRLAETDPEFHQAVKSVHDVPAWFLQKEKTGEGKEILYRYKELIKLNDFGKNTAHNFLNTPEWEIIKYARHFQAHGKYLSVFDKPYITLDEDSQKYQLKIDVGGIKKIVVAEGEAQCKKVGTEEGWDEYTALGHFLSFSLDDSVVGKNYILRKYVCRRKQSELDNMKKIERILLTEYYASRGQRYAGNEEETQKYQLEYKYSSKQYTSRHHDYSSGNGVRAIDNYSTTDEVFKIITTGVRCNNSAVSGVVSRHYDNGMICAAGGRKVQKCDNNWSIKQAAEYLCQ